MAEMFAGASEFNASIGSWDVSSVKDMSSMFAGATEFNANLGGWDVSNVENMREMFSSPEDPYNKLHPPSFKGLNNVGFA